MWLYYYYKRAVDAGLSVSEHVYISILTVSNLLTVLQPVLMINASKQKLLNLCLRYL